ncbi:two-component system response regulator [Paenibacillus sp. J23TS9]|uniref:response regulator n=1 Tax=Paenibacillus sp. J23TS9 TaxID=2807193 RepID=UPI001B2D8907|nr:response regulator [Paenibacillus sp. J23TS9]GIP26161.1 two-component system response regulator [Paenibacillus sp. J23TS9]
METSHQNGTIDVLIVEDDVKIAEINRRFIEQVPGFKVVGIATDEMQAKTQLEVLEPGLVLLDIYLPRVSGLELLLYIRQKYRSTDVIMITAAREIEPVGEAIRSGAFDYLMKPLVFDRLKETLQRYALFHQELLRLGRAGSIGQNDVDRLLSGAAKSEAVPDSGSLPKGIDRLTLEKVIHTISHVGEAHTAHQIARMIGISRSTSRRYLEHLVGVGIVHADLSYGLVGRPERVYRSKG